VHALDLALIRSSLAWLRTRAQRHDSEHAAGAQLMAASTSPRS
jgi:hypothetical protein